MKLIYTASQVREAEKPYIEAVDYDGYLMQRAADAVAAEAQELLHGTENAKILLLIGPGNQRRRHHLRRRPPQRQGPPR